MGSGQCINCCFPLARVRARHVPFPARRVSECATMSALRPYEGTSLDDVLVKSAEPPDAGVDDGADASAPALDADAAAHGEVEPGGPELEPSARGDAGSAQDPRASAGGAADPSASDPSVSGATGSDTSAATPAAGGGTVMGACHVARHASGSTLAYGLACLVALLATTRRTRRAVRD